MASRSSNNKQGDPKGSMSVDDPLSMFLIDAEQEMSSEGNHTHPSGTTTTGDKSSDDALRMAEDMMNSIVQDMGDDLNGLNMNSKGADGVVDTLEDINIDSFLDVEEDDQHDAVVVVNSNVGSANTAVDGNSNANPGANHSKPVVAARCIDDDAMMFNPSELDDLDDEANHSEIDLTGSGEDITISTTVPNEKDASTDASNNGPNNAPHVVKLPLAQKESTTISCTTSKGMGHSLKKKAAKMAASFGSPSRTNKETTLNTDTRPMEDPLWNNGSSSPKLSAPGTFYPTETVGSSGPDISSGGHGGPPLSNSSGGKGNSSSSGNPLDSIKKAGSSALSQATASTTFGSLFQKAAANISSFTASADAALSSVVTQQQTHPSQSSTGIHPSFSPSSLDSEDVQHTLGGSSSSSNDSTRRMMMIMNDNFQLLQNPAIQSQLLTMALGGTNTKPLHQGERIILFLPHVVNVATSSSPVSGVASSATIVAATGGTTASSSSNSTSLSSQQLWAMCITFYRVILFNYTISQVEQMMGIAPGCVTSDASSVASSGTDTATGTNAKKGTVVDSQDRSTSIASTSATLSSPSTAASSNMSTAARQGLDNAVLRAGLSRQWQFHHAPSYQKDIETNNSNDEGKTSGESHDGSAAAASSSSSASFPFKHFVLQLPLGAIDRVEKGDVPYSMASNSTVLSNSMSFTPGGGVGGGRGSNINNSGVRTNSNPQPGSSTRGNSSNINMMSGHNNESRRNSTDHMNGSSGNNTTINAATPMTTAQQTIVLYDKGGSNRWIRFTSVNLADAIRAHEALSTYAFPGKRNLGYLFAFEACREQVLALNNSNNNNNQGASSNAKTAPNLNDSKTETNSISNKALPNNSRYHPLKEFARMGITARGLNNGGGTMVGRYSQQQPWTITNANVNYHLCSSYPSILVVPTCASPEVSGDSGRRLLTQCASFRSERRLPVLAWGNGTDAASIWRCSQPKVGLGGNRNSGDEAYLKALSETAGRYIKHSTMKLPPAYTRLLTGANDAESDVLSFLKVQIKAVTLSSAGVSTNSSKTGHHADKRGGLQSASSKGNTTLRMSSSGSSSASSSPTSHSNSNDNYSTTTNTTTTVPLGLPPLKIMDLRPKSAAMANRTQGYGYESSSNYPQGQISFYNIANIHGVRESLGKLSSLAMNPVTQDINFTSLVESTGWLTLIRTILNASWQCAAIVNFHRLPVLLHCSHGWDRTSQVSALAQLMLDSYYRTIKGFAVLIEKEFSSFGHPFHLRCGHGEGSAGDFYTGSGGQSTTGTGQRSPIFMQFIDCVWQLVNQFPTFFEFNTRYLLVICDHIYSCRFGTFLCDNERERIAAGIYERTQSLWDYIDDIGGDVSRGGSEGGGGTSSIFINPFYNSMTNLLIPPLPCLLRQVTLWSDYHLRYSPRAYLACLPKELVPYVIPSSTSNNGRASLSTSTNKATTLGKTDASDDDSGAASVELPNELSSLFCSRDEQDALLHKMSAELERMKRLCQSQESEIATLKKGMTNTTSSIDTSK